MELINRPEVMDGVRMRHDWIVAALNDLNQRLHLFKTVRGLGLLIGAVLNDDFAGKAKQINLAAADQGVMVLIAGANVVRFRAGAEYQRTGSKDRYGALCPGL